MIEQQHLNRVSIEFGREYMNTKMPKGGLVEKSLCLNSSAHGFFMGVRHREKLFKKFLSSKKPLSPETADQEGQRAAKYYVMKKFPNMQIEDRAIVANSVKMGFIAGMRFCESKVLSS